MFQHDHYVPILKAKQGELRALSQLGSSVLNFTPLLEVEAISVPVMGPPRTLAGHISLMIDRVRPLGSRLFFLDTEAVSAVVAPSGASGPHQTLTEVHQAGMTFVPVCRLRQSTPDVLAALAYRSRGICLRLYESDIGSASWPASLNGFLSLNSLAHHEVDLVLDFGSVLDAPEARGRSLIQGALALIPSILQWRTLTVAASAFPMSMVGIPRQSSRRLTRTEWLSWLGLHGRRQAVARMPTFGDYGIQHPTGSDGFDPRFMAVSAAIRYTLDTEWLILKGQSMKIQGGTTQFPGLAQRLVAMPDFMGASHCPGCADIVACANGASGLSSSTVWRRIGTAHHISHVSSQIAQLPFP